MSDTSESISKITMLGPSPFTASVIWLCALSALVSGGAGGGGGGGARLICRSVSGFAGGVSVLSVRDNGNRIIANDTQAHKLASNCNGSDLFIGIRVSRPLS